ncbi:MAG: sulfite exporter TauE/SafE family protein [Alphaproteobacteria bacterium]|nr:sulfite exporter TauE/SafE family protein [Alphaproteobacteria bacterium]
MIEASEARIHISRLRAAGLGLLAGVMNGLIALGGGVLITPLLVVAGVNPQIAVGTSLAAVTMLSCIGFTAHFLLGGISLGLVPIVAAVVGGAAGTVLGSKILARLTPHWMLILFAIIQILVAIRLIDQGLGLALLGEVIPGGAPLWAYVALGLFAGTLSGIFGVGGGALVLLGLAAFYGVPVVEGLAIALALNVTNALAGVVHHARQGRVLWQELKILMPTAVIGIGAGAALAHELPADAMRVVFGGFFMFMGIMLAQKGWAVAKKNQDGDAAVN